MNSSIGELSQVFLALTSQLIRGCLLFSKLKPEARPIEESNNPYRVVSGADCRLMAFSTVHDATKIWIKGREFTVSRLLGDAYKNEAERYNGGALAIFRLAPQDYHRFHCPVDGVVGKMTYIAGEYYTVNVSAINMINGDFRAFLLTLSTLSNVADAAVAAAASDPNGFRCLWRKCTKDRSL